jgi:hypothetical protein
VITTVNDIEIDNEGIQAFFDTYVVRNDKARIIGRRNGIDTCGRRLNRSHKLKYAVYFPVYTKLCWAVKSGTLPLTVPVNQHCNSPGATGSVAGGKAETLVCDLSANDMEG